MAGARVTLDLARRSLIRVDDRHQGVNVSVTI